MATPLRVLIVEDNQDAARSLAWLLEVWGHEAATAPDALTALDIVPRFFPDVVLLDIGLPGMDGFELAEILRLNLSLRHTVLVAITAYGDEYTRLRARAAGISEHFIKPADLDRLQAVLADIKRRRDEWPAEDSHKTDAVNNAS
jgi:two-component system, chemotaxis family, CheB/CheR fusion protein